MIRKMVKIDEEKCNGCGLCVPSCAEGAIQIIDGKARLIADNLCDGLGACLGHCPQGAIQVESRAAAPFDEEAVRRHLAVPETTKSPASELTHWPVQLKLLPATAPVLRGAFLLVAADCVPVAFPSLHQDFLQGKAVMMGCPKFDDVQHYVEKFAQICKVSGINSFAIYSCKWRTCFNLMGINSHKIIIL